MLDSPPTPARHPSPGVLSTLLVHDTPRLAIRNEIGVLFTIERNEIVPEPGRSPTRATGRASMAPWADRPATGRSAGIGDAPAASPAGASPSTRPADSAGSC